MMRSIARQFGGPSGPVGHLVSRLLAQANADFTVYNSDGQVAALLQHAGFTQAEIRVVFGDPGHPGGRVMSGKRSDLDGPEVPHRSRTGDPIGFSWKGTGSSAGQRKKIYSGVQGAGHQESGR